MPSVNFQTGGGLWRADLAQIPRFSLNVFFFSLPSRYQVIGNERTFAGLNELVAFHSKHALTDDGDCLTTPCEVDKKDLTEFE